MARNRTKERESGKDKKSNAIKEYLVVKCNNMDEMAASKSEENNDVAHLADLKYRSAYLWNWMQLSNSEVPHELLSSVLPPLPEGITLPHAILPNNIACHFHFPLPSTQQKKKKKSHKRARKWSAASSRSSSTRKKRRVESSSSDSSDTSTSAAMVNNKMKVKTKTKKNRESYWRGRRGNYNWKCYPETQCAADDASTASSTYYNGYYLI